MENGIPWCFRMTPSNRFSPSATEENQLMTVMKIEVPSLITSSVKSDTAINFNLPSPSGVEASARSKMIRPIITSKWQMAVDRHCTRQRREREREADASLSLVQKFSWKSIRFTVAPARFPFKIEFKQPGPKEKKARAVCRERTGT